MVDVSSQNNSVSINVSSSGNSASIKASPDTAQYYSEKSREYATSDKLIDGKDYSSKYYAQQSNVNAQKVVQSENNVKEIYNSLLEESNSISNEIRGVGNEIVSSIEATKIEAENSISSTKTTILNDIEFVADGEKEEILGLADEIKDSAEDIINRVGLNMFDTILKDHVLTYEESKGLALQGTYVYKEAIAGSRYGYPDFYNKCLEEYTEATETETVNGVTVKVHSNGHKFYDISDKTGIDDFFNTMGLAWFYGIDTENKRIFLPRNNWFEQATGESSEVGQSVEAGLPNIEGYFDTLGAWYSSNLATGGAFTTSGNSGTSFGLTKGNGNDARRKSFDASRSSAVYGNSNTVQPNAVKKLLYICVGNTVSDTSWVDVVTQVEGGVKDIEVAEEEAIARLKATSNALNQTQITNCLLEVPQNIKLELNDGVLTLKAGSKVIVPNGVGVFDEVAIEKDLSLTWTQGEYNLTLFCVASGKQIVVYNSNADKSGTEIPTSASNFYNTETNTVYRYSSNGQGAQLSFPIARVTSTTNAFSSIDQVFNGFGYIGMHGWIDKGVKVLRPNGRNADGTLNNIEYTTPKTIVRTVHYGANSFNWWLRSIDAFDIFGQSEFFVSETEPIYNGRCEWYNPKENIIRYKKTADSDFIVYDGVIVASSSGTDSGVTSLQSKQPFRAIDYFDKSEIGSWSMPSGKSISLTPAASGTLYTAPANGIVRAWGYKNTSTNCYINLFSNKGGAAGGYVPQNWGSPNMSIRVEKGDQFQVADYNNISEARLIFYYLKSEV